MPLSVHIALAIVLAPALWLAGAIFFDLVHWILHALLRSRFRGLRALAWPHAIHHQWIDRGLRVRWELQRRNVCCHLVPEYLTQLAFTAGLALLLPLPYVAALAVLQTTAFVFLLRARGLDINHRPIEMLDAYRPGFLTPPAYHALHHVYPDAYFSAYTKTVDWLVGGGAQLRGRRFALVGARTGFDEALAGELRRAGIDDVERWAALEPGKLAGLDVLVLCDGEQSPVAAVEAFVEATRARQLPPEVWSVHAAPDDPVARHYHRDVRVNYRTIVRRDDAVSDPPRARRAARIALCQIRRGFNFVTTEASLRAIADLRRFHRTAPASPAAARSLRHRSELLRAVP